MCGFVGFVDRQSEEDKNKILDKMLETIVHRGPDSEGRFIDDGLAVGFRRLSIIDLSDAGSQPIYNEDKTMGMVFNGEIYNYKELRLELIDLGHRFVSNTDSEVVIHGYEEFGEEILQKLRGMFAFAIWDTKDKSIFIARDFFGIKPMYYYQGADGLFMFGSEIKSFLEHPNFDKRLNRSALRPYLTFQYSALEQTFFKGVYHLPQGHFLKYQVGGIVRVQRYYTPEFKVERHFKDYYEDKIDETVRESVDVHRNSDVKLGAFLSGGVDSSYITTLLKPDDSFSVGFENKDFDETALAEELSARIGVKNYKRHITADECFDKMGLIQYHMDEPQSNPSSLPLYFLAELASEHVTVVLSGEGADELFGGYHWYNQSAYMRLYRHLPRRFRGWVRRLCERGDGKSKISNFLIRGGQSVEETFIGQAKVFEEEEAVDILTEDFSIGPPVKDVTSVYYNQIDTDDDLIKKQYLDMNLWLPGDILLKADKMSMAHSLELRVPFLDKHVMELAGKIPTEYKVNNRDVKYIFRKAAMRVLPKKWAKRYKLGFPVPIAAWFKEEKYYSIIKDMFERDYVSLFFDQEKLLALLEDHYTGKSNNARKIYTVYTYLIWYEEFFVKR